jgi:TPR repeat protein
MKFPIGSPFRSILAAASLAAGALFAQDEKPVLVSRAGGASWSDVAELKASAKQGNAKACAQLGELMLRGDAEVARDVPAAVAMLEQAARGGEASAAFRLGMLLVEGEVLAADPARALAYFRAAAAGGALEGFHNLGVAFSTGRGTKRDYPEALAWLLLAKQHGDTTSAAEDLRKHLKSLGHPEWITAGDRRALELEREISRGGVAGFLPPPAPSPLSAKAEAADVPTSTVDHPPLTGNFSALPPPNIAVLPHLPGAVEEAAEEPPVKLVVPTGRALHWANLTVLEKLADREDPDALAALGQVKLEGKLIVEDVPGAIAVLERGAKAGSADAAAHLAELYTKGLRTARDDVKAFTFTLQAARGGVSADIYNLGALYANGRGTKVDYTEALAWLIVAQHFNLDSGQATRIRDYLAKSDAKQIPVAERRAAERVKAIEAARAALPGA